MTYPVGGQTSPQRKAIQETLPPPLSGCNCSMCNAVQSLGAMTFGSNSPMLCKGHVSRWAQSYTVVITNLHTLFVCSSGQQILRGDRVIVKGEKPGEHLELAAIKVLTISFAGTVKYIGRLEGGLSNDVYIGVQLDAPG